MEKFFKIVVGIIIAIIAIGLCIVVLGLLLIALIVIKIVALIANHRSKSIWRKGDTLHVPVVDFVNTDTNQKVSFLGCIHIGDNGFYRTLEHIIAQSPNTLVLCEGTRETFTDQEKIDKHPYTLIAKLIGVVTQFTMHYQPTWEFNDHEEKLSQLSRIFKILQKKNKDGKTFEEVIKELKPESKKKIGRLLATLILNMTFLKIITSFKKKKWRDKVIEHVIINMRNEYAIKHVDTKKDHPHLILLWGAGHLPGMEKLLRERGFKRTYSKWIPAFTRLKK